MIRRRTTPRPKALWAKGKPEPKKVWKRIRGRSKRETTRMLEYNRRRKDWLRGHKTCQVFPPLPATCIHHSRGRAGSLLLDDRYWIPVSIEGHQWIHDNLEKARALGLLCQRGDWNRAPK